MEVSGRFTPRPLHRRRGIPVPTEQKAGWTAEPGLTSWTLTLKNQMEGERGQDRNLILCRRFMGKHFAGIDVK
jgi:hypothetical protein